MNRLFIVVSPLVAVAVLATAALAAAPKLKAVPSIKSNRLVVTVTSAKKLKARSQPRKVTAKAGGASYALKLVSRTKKKSVWRSSKLDAAVLAALAGKPVKIKIKTRAGSVAVRRSLPAGTTPGPGPVGPAPGGQAPAPTPAPTATPTPGLTFTRNDDAGRQALGTDDLLLERCDCGGSTVLTYYRLFFYANGLFRYEKADWNSVSGEICDSNARREGSWSFAEGYTFPERGGGVAVKVNITTNGQPGNDVLTFANQDPSHVWVGQQLIQFDRNPNMRDQC
jgi:hypothetical protein